MKEKKLNPLSTHWYPEEINIVLEGYENKDSFEKIADKLNSLRKSLAVNNYSILRTSGAVAYRLHLLGKITIEEVNNHYKTRKQEKTMLRSRSLEQAKEIILRRDGNSCVFCNSKEQLEFAHVIPFRKSKVNKEKESITLCKNHHKIFDSNEKEMTEFIFKKMSEYYEDYSKDYILKEVYCSYHKKHHYEITGINS